MGVETMPRGGLVRRVVGWTAMLAAIPVLGLPSAASGVNARAADASRGGSTTPLPTRPDLALWVHLSGTLTRSELQNAAAKYAVIVLNAWDTNALKTIKAANARVKVLVYKDLSSTRSYAISGGYDDAYLPTGVGYDAADPSWFAQNTYGLPIEWQPYPGHWQMKVWDPAYRQAWTQNVVSETVSQGWDGVFADNAMRTLAPYSADLLSEAPSRDGTDDLLEQGVDALINQAGAALNADDKVLIPNVPDGRLDVERWQRDARFGGAMDENFAHWGTDPVLGYVTDWGPTGWQGQTAQLTVPLSLVITHAASGDK